MVSLSMLGHHMLGDHMLGPTWTGVALLCPSLPFSQSLVSKETRFEACTPLHPFLVGILSVLSNGHSMSATTCQSCRYIAGTL